MHKSFAFWIALLSAFISSGLALRVALTLGLAAQLGAPSFAAELATQSG